MLAQGGHSRAPPTPPSPAGVSSGAQGLAHLLQRGSSLHFDKVHLASHPVSRWLMNQLAPPCLGSLRPASYSGHHPPPRSTLDALTLLRSSLMPTRLQHTGSSKRHRLTWQSSRSQPLLRAPQHPSTSFPSILALSTHTCDVCHTLPP